MIIKRECVFDINPPFPRNILMEPTNACNHTCVFCGNKYKKRRNSICDIDLFFRIITEAFELGSREIGFYLGGEPFLYKNLSELVMKANSVGYEYIYITTNGALANIDKVKNLVDCGLSSIKYSVNAASRDIYKIIHGKDDFEIVKDNIINLCIERKKWASKLAVYISFVENSINIHEKKILYDIFGNYVDSIYYYTADNQSGYNENNDLIIESGNQNINVPCEMLFNRIHVTSDGYMDACCIDYDNKMAFADLREVSLLDAWNSPIMKDLRRQHLEKKIANNQCFNCIFNRHDDVEPLNEKLYKKYLSQSKNMEG